MSIDEVDRSSLVFIAAHDDAALEMEKYARALGFTRVISIYHHLFDIEVGEPVQRNIPVKVSKLIKNLHSGCLPAVYYFSLCDYLGHNKYNGAIYKKTYMHFTTFKSAEQRWNRFKDRIYQFENKGFFQDYNVKIARDYCLMDCFHRLILAKYYNVDALSCDVYDCDASYFSNNIFSQDVLIQKKI
ncbi:MAG: hypothetical protein E7202_00545 [Selenomonas ruminantium]|jgi:hypothetical protein|nr:hypothetical protein [Selenomonas ruminantium]